jgi:outer membrane protein OmpA-like peptidoglycan-associated protein
MKRKNLYFSMLLSMVLLISSCATTKNTKKGGLFGAGAGAAIGAGIGAIIGGGKGAAIGAAAGTAVGATAGVLIGKKMDKQQAELEAIEGAKVETVTDVNNLQAIKVTFDSGILFNTGKSDLSSESKAALSDFANSLKNTPETDVTIVGHTDNTGSRAVNDRLSFERAKSVSKYITQLGIEENRTTENGVAFDEPIADNSTAEGRKQNRRVEVFITANETMIEQAENGTLK